MDRNPDTNDTGYCCSDIESKLDDYLEQQLSSSEIEKFHNHTSRCTRCETFVAELKCLKEIAASLAESEIPSGVRERLHLRLAQEPDWTPKRRPQHLRLVK